MFRGLLRTIEPAPKNEVNRPRLRKRVSERGYPKQSEVRLSVVIVNFCQWRNTAHLIRQLRHSEALLANRAEIVVIDNHSPHHPTISKLRRTDGVSLRRFSQNRGFAYAVNEGCSLGEGEWLLLLNPDMSVSRGFLDEVEQLAKKMDEENPNVGVMGFRLVHPDGGAQASCGPFPTLMNTLGGLFLPRAERKCRILKTENRTIVPWVTGCCFLIRRDCLISLGGFDEDFFLYYEDVDLCLRAARKGWDIFYEPKLKVTHHTPLHMRSVPAPLRLMTRHALLIFSKKHWPRWQTYLLSSIIWLEAFLKQIKNAISGQVEEARFYHELRKLVLDVLHHRKEKAHQRIYQAALYLESTSTEQDGKCS